MSRLRFLSVLVVLLLAFAAGASRAASAGPSASASWTGTWDTSYGNVSLVQSGDQVTGTYEYQDGGKITGTVSGSVLTGTWEDASRAGDFVFTLSADGNSFTGQWRYAGESSWGTWNGKRLDVPSEQPGAAAGIYGTIDATTKPAGRGAIGIRVVRQDSGRLSVDWVAVRGPVSCAKWNPKRDKWTKIDGYYAELWPTAGRRRNFKSVPLAKPQPIDARFIVRSTFRFWSVTDPEYEESQLPGDEPRLDVVELNARFTNTPLNGMHATGTIRYTTYGGPRNRRWLAKTRNLEAPSVAISRCVSPKWHFDAVLGAPYYN